MHTKQKNDPKMPSLVFPLYAFKFEGERTHDGLDIVISGVKAITDFSSQNIELSLSGGGIVISGERLCVTSLERQTVQIIGVIKEIRVKYVKIKNR